MICGKCNHDLSACFCADMPERFESAKKFVLFGAEYSQRLTEQAERVRKKRADQKEVVE